MSFMAMVFSIAVIAVPAKRTKRTVTMQDGSQVEAIMVGDEHGHWLVDSEGKALKLQDGVGQYLTRFQLENLKTARQERVGKSNARRVARMLDRRKADVGKGPLRAFGEPTAIKGKKKGIVILINYKDTKFKAANTQSVFNNRFNQVGYNASGYVGSVHDYFYDQSYGQLDLTFDVIGPVTVSQNMSYYGANDYYGDDKRPATMVIEALKLIDSQVNFRDYDWDGDGEVDQVFCIYAGQGEAASNIDETIWPHEWSLAEAAEYGDGDGIQTLDGVKIDTYAVSCELADASTIDGLGTACHEFSHCLGYADLYDTDYSGGQGMMGWDLMDGGSYNGPSEIGEVPAPYTSFERWWAGWMTLTELTQPCKVEGMKPLTSQPEAYVIYNQANRNEYYLLENHQQEKWDSYTGGHGMMILHVDYDKAVWQNNAPNDNPSRQRMTFIPADNNYGTKMTYGSGQYGWYATPAQIAGDPWPGTSRKTAFTDTSTPAAILYNANVDGRKYLGKPIENISESQTGLISFNFDGGVAIPVPQILPATNITATGFTANWGAVDGATSYNLEVLESVAGQSTTSFSEDFSKINVTADGSDDISSKLDNYTQKAGWTGSAVFLAEGGLKLGSSKKVGNVVTPLIDAPADGKVTVKANLESYNDDGSSVVVSLVNASGSVIGQAQTVAIGDGGEMEFSFDNVTSDFKIKFACAATKKRFYLYSVQIGGASAQKHHYSGITATSYQITGLTGPAVRYCVQAVTADGTSRWSEYADLTLAPVILGDVNGDGVVDKRDVPAMLDIINGKAEKTAAADLDNNGIINVRDLVLLISKLSKP